MGASFAGLATYLGDEDVKEPTELFATLQKFLVRFDAIYREVEYILTSHVPRGEVNTHLTLCTL